MVLEVDFHLACAHAVHGQSVHQANTVSEMFPNAEIMICSGHAGHAQIKILELWHKNGPNRQWISTGLIFLLCVSSAV